MAYNLSFHTDTDNLHIHFSFIEKEPNYIGTNNKISYRRKGKLTQEEIDFMKNEVVLAVERKQYLQPMITIINEEIEKLKGYFNPKEKNFILYDKKDLLIEEKIIRLGKLLFEEREYKNKRIKFNSIKDSEIINLTKEIKYYLFNNKSNLYNEYLDFKSSLNNINDSFLLIFFFFLLIVDTGLYFRFFCDFPTSGDITGNLIFSFLEEFGTFKPPFFGVNKTDIYFI